jgi:alpha-L-fucosidase
LLADRSKQLTTSRDGDDVIVSLPARAPDEIASVVSLRLDSAPKVRPYVIRPDQSGVLNLGVESCEIQTRFEQRAKKENFLGHVFLTRWTRPDDIPTWTFSVPKAGKYRVEVSYAAARPGVDNEFAVITGSASVRGKVANTTNYQVFKTFPLGTVQLAAGEQKLQVKPEGQGGVDIMHLERVRLIPE